VLVFDGGSFVGFVVHAPRFFPFRSLKEEVRLIKKRVANLGEKHTTAKIAFP